MSSYDSIYKETSCDTDPEQTCQRICRFVIGRDGLSYVAVEMLEPTFKLVLDSDSGLAEELHTRRNKDKGP